MTDDEILDQLAPTGLNDATAVMAVRAANDLRQTTDAPGWRTWISKLEDPALLKTSLAPSVAALLSWYRAPGRDDPVTAAQAIHRVLTAAAPAYDDLRADTREIRLSPLSIRSLLAADQDDFADSDVLRQISSAAQWLTAGLWAALGASQHRYCVCLSASGPVWQTAPADPERRRQHLLTAHRHSVPFYQIHPQLSAMLPSEPEGWMTPDFALIDDLAADMQIRVDTRLRYPFSSQEPLPAEPSGRIHEVRLSDRYTLLLGSQRSILAPVQNEPMMIPFCLCRGQQRFSAAFSVDDLDRAAYWQAVETDEEIIPPLRTAQRYAGEMSRDGHGAQEALTTVLTSVAMDIRDPEVNGALKTGPSSLETDPGVGRQQRRQARRDRESGTGRIGVTLNWDAPGRLTTMRAFEVDLERWS